MLAAIGLLPALVGAGGDAASPRTAEAAEGDAAVTPELDEVEGCFVDLPDELSEAQAALTCGYVSVPLHHDEPGGDEIRLAVAVIDGNAIPVLDSDTETDTARAGDDHPLMLLGGGPGERTIPTLLPTVLVEPGRLGLPVDGRDLVLVEQRGIGPSEPSLDCPGLVEEAAPAGASPFEAPRTLDDLRGDGRRPAAGQAVTADVASAAAACFERLTEDEDIDLSAFNTAANVQDLDLVRRALGHEQMHLYGVSYGAKLALRASAAFPDSWATQTLSSAIPGGANFMEDINANFADTLERLGDACDADAAGCDAAWGDVPAGLDDAMGRLADDPATVEIPAGDAGEPVRLELTDTVAANLIYQLFYGFAEETAPRIAGLSEGRYADALLAPTRALPQLVEALPAGVSSLAGLSEAVTAQQDEVPAPEPDSVSGVVVAGMQLALVCSEEYGWADLDAQQPGPDAPAAVEAFSEAIAYGYLAPEVCDAFDVDPVESDPFEPVATSVPTLVVNGGLDQITPPSYGDAVAETLVETGTAVTKVDVPDATHHPAGALGPCAQQLIEGFLAEPGGDPAGCAQDRELDFDVVLPELVTPRVVRIAGADRFATAGQISGWTFRDDTDVAYVAEGGKFPDALTGGAAAGTRQAPVLLTTGDAVTPATADELARLAPDQVKVLGGTNRISEATANQLGEAANAAVDRLAGPTRFETGAQVSADAFPDGADLAFVATGTGFADALAGGAVAATLDAPVLLTAPGQLPAAVADELNRLDPQGIVVLGGTQAVSDAVAAQLADIAPLDRVAGANRFETAALLAAPFTGSQLPVHITSGTSFADALAGGPLAAGRGPLLLSTADELTAPTEAALNDIEPGVAVVLGGSAAVGEQPAGSIDPLLGQPTGPGPASMLEAGDAHRQRQ